MPNTSSEQICKKCKSKVVNGWKCIHCESVFHSSCGKRKNVKIVSDNLIICCEKSEAECVVPDVDSAFFDAIEEISGNDKKINIEIFNYLIKQKDLIINGLNDKIKLLNQQIDLILSNNTISNQQKKDQSDLICNVVNQKHNNLPNEKKIIPPPKMPENQVISKDQVSLAINEAESQAKLNEIINLPNNASTSKQDEWTTVVRKNTRRRQIIVGSNQESTEVTGVPEVVSLHVYRLNPKTTAENLTTLMKSHLSEFKCEQLNSKFPNVYSSFKVTIFGNSFKKAMDASIWPFGACVSRFLSKRRVDVPERF